MNIPCSESGCKEMFGSALELKLHKYETHKIISDSDKRLLKRWVDVK